MLLTTYVSQLLFERATTPFTLDLCLCLEYWFQVDYIGDKRIAWKAGKEEGTDRSQSQDQVKNKDQKKEGAGVSFEVKGKQCSKEA